MLGSTRYADILELSSGVGNLLEEVPGDLADEEIVLLLKIQAWKLSELAEDVGFTRVVKSWENGDERICRGAPHVIVVHGDKNWAFGVEDCTLALSYLDLYASNMGLGTCWGGYFYSAANQYKPLFKELGVPDDHRVYGAMMVGYRKYHYHRLPKRKPPVVIWK